MAYQSRQTYAINVISFKCYRKQIWPNDVGCDEKSTILNKYLSAESATETATSSVSNIYCDTVSASQIPCSTTENDFNQSDECVEGKSEQSIEENIDWDNHANDSSVNIDKISIDSETILRRIKVSTVFGI